MNSNISILLIVSEIKFLFFWNQLNKFMLNPTENFALLKQIDLISLMMTLISLIKKQTKKNFEQLNDKIGNKKTLLNFHETFIPYFYFFSFTTNCHLSSISIFQEKKNAKNINKLVQNSSLQITIFI